MDYYHHEQPYGPSDPYAAGQKRQQRPPTCEEDNVTELKEKVMIPAEEYPGYNFVGSLLGPQGTILKGLQKATNAKMGIYGKGSMRDKKKEEELTNSDEAEHAHLKESLHVLVEVKGPRAEAHWRMANALTEVYKFMMPPPDQQGGGGGNGYGYGNEGAYDPYSAAGGYDGYDGGAPARGGRGGGAPRGGAPGRGRGGAPQQRGRGGPPRGGHGGAPPAQSNTPRGGASRPHGGGGGAHGAPPAAAEEQYGYTETTNYQWDGNYNNTRTSEAELQTSNGFTLKRYNDSYNESYNESY